MKYLSYTAGTIAILTVISAILFAFIGPIAIIYGNDQKVIFGAVACTIAIVVASAFWGYLSTKLGSKKEMAISIGLLLLAATAFVTSLISGFNCDSQRYLTWAAALTSYITVVHPFIFGVIPLLH